jgi:CRP-like cAMP-binding protein
VLPSENRLLSRLSSKDYERLLSKLHYVEFKSGDVVYEARSAIEFAYFPINAVMSELSILPDGDAIEVATIGNEGGVGLAAYHGTPIATNKIISQIPGRTLRLEIRWLQQALDHSPELRNVLFRYQQAFLAQMSQSVACNGLHKIEQRCCRWLLLTHDRVGSGEFPLTHEFLAFMLGVRRAGVTEVLQSLKNQGLINYTRGSITVLDRPGLERACCVCYRMGEEQYDRLLN